MEGGIGRTATIGLLAATAGVFVILIVALPVHATPGGGGSIRCGTVIKPISDPVFGRICTDARGPHLAASVAATVILCAIALAPLGAQGIRKRWEVRFWVITWSTIWLLAAVVALVLIGSG